MSDTAVAAVLPGPITPPAPVPPEPHLRHLDGEREAVELDALVAPIELVGLARIEAQRHEGLDRHPGPLLAPGLHEAMHAVVGALVAAPAQFLEQALRRAPLTPGQLGLGLQDRGQDRHERPELGLGLDLALVGEGGGVRAQHPAHRVARDPELAGDALDPFAVLVVLEPDPRDRLHTRHPPPLRSPPERAFTQVEGD